MVLYVWPDVDGGVKDKEEKKIRRKEGVRCEARKMIAMITDGRKLEETPVSSCIYVERLSLV